ncbi:MAG: hypothetical protein RIQ93_573 [Verrucomicrobiota bacterium]|jgi:UPF0271 protein
MPFITSANIACGAHAGNLAAMIEAVELARMRRVAIGAHPGFFDLENFGRVERDISSAEAGRIVLMQVEQLFEIAGSALCHVKLHGALYNQVSRDRRLAESLATDLSRLWPRLVVFALAGSHFAQAARSRGLNVAQEVFADRSYQPDGALMPRGQAGAVITDPHAAVAQALRLAQEGTMRAVNGEVIALQADTICIHGDGKNAVELARRLHTGLKAAGIRIKAISGGRKGG